MDVSKCLHNLLVFSTHISRFTINLSGHIFKKVIPVLACLLLLLSTSAKCVDCTPQFTAIPANSSHFSRGYDIQFPVNDLM